MNLTPASSSDLPSEAIFTRVSESGTRLMQTAIFIAFSVVRYPSSEGLRSAGKETRRADPGNGSEASCGRRTTDDGRRSEIRAQAHLHAARISDRRPSSVDRRPQDASRSEEHTSELQSPCNLVCRLL